jgi:hypothetical protein
MAIHVFVFGTNKATVKEFCCSLKLSHEAYSVLTKTN